MKPMNVIVYNDGKKVFNGPLKQFLADNEYDPDVVEECAKLETEDSVEMLFFSGHWLVRRQ